MKEVWSGQDQTSSFVSALPIFPGRRQPSIFGTSELNCRVRNGNGWTLTVINTNYGIGYKPNTTPLFAFCQVHVPHWMYTTHPMGTCGTPSGTRTLDTLIKSQVLYQLS